MAIYKKSYSESITFDLQPTLIETLIEILVDTNGFYLGFLARLPEGIC